MGRHGGRNDGFRMLAERAGRENLVAGQGTARGCDTV